MTDHLEPPETMSFIESDWSKRMYMSSGTFFGFTEVPAHLHPPFRHWLSPQLSRQAPQLAASLARLTSQPSSGFSLQSPNPTEQP